VTTEDARYSAEVRWRFLALPGAGELPQGERVVEGRAGDCEQGAAITLQLQLESGRVVRARFRAFGCPHFLAGASWLTDRLTGAQRADLERWDWREAADALQVPPAKFARFITLQDAVRAAARNWPGDAESTV
jgi:NifU-like protein involved in Fe-S cluster formation